MKTIEQGKKERLELKDQLKRRKSGKKRTKHLRKEFMKWRMQVHLPYCHYYYWFMIRSINIGNLKFTYWRGEGEDS